jgi:2-polyprenyl-3-methyl-5-hydroxy-6-metoxy-1,4-benzoquinol methylase
VSDTIITVENLGKKYSLRRAQPERYTALRGVSAGSSNMKSHSRIQDHALEFISDAEARQFEDSLWWVSGRKAIIRRFLKRAATSRQVSRLMDIGCGSGGSLDVLAEFGSVIGVEPSEILAQRARQRGIATVVHSQDVLELDECRRTDVFTMFDVLEHIENDVEFLTQLRKKAGRGHLLLISVPACPFMFGEHDRILHHHRRYSAQMLFQTLEKAGYRIVRLCPFMFFLFPFVLLSRMKDKLAARFGRKRTTIEVGHLPPFLSVVFSLALRIEGLWSQHVHFPIGLWLFALAESPEESSIQSSY